MHWNCLSYYLYSSSFSFFIAVQLGRSISWLEKDRDETEQTSRDDTLGNSSNDKAMDVGSNRDIFTTSGSLPFLFTSMDSKEDIKVLSIAGQEYSNILIRVTCN